MPRSTRDGSQNLTQLHSTLAVPKAQLAVVSPCSECKNRRTEAKDGKSACPRLALRQKEEQGKASGQPLPPAYDLALKTGTSSDALANPVYDDENNHILIWAAHLQDNMGVYRDGKLVPESVLGSANFDTDYIVCSQLPYMLGESEAAYRARGAYRGWDSLETVEIQPFPLDVAHPGVEADYDSLRVAGYARKIDVPYNYPRQPVSKDLSPQGM